MNRRDTEPYVRWCERWRGQPRRLLDGPPSVKINSTILVILGIKQSSNTNERNYLEECPWVHHD